MTGPSGSSESLTGESGFELRPLSAVELVDGALEMCSRHFAHLLVLVLPGYLLLAGSLMMLVSLAELPPPMSEYSGGAGFYFALGGLVSLLLLLSHVSHGAGVYYLYRAETGAPVSLPGALGRALRKSGSLITVAALTYLFAGLGAVFLLVPGIAAYCAFALCTPVVMIEQMSYIRAIRRGYRMLRDFFGRSLKAHILLGALWLVLFLTLHAMVHIGLQIVRSFFDIEVGFLSKALTLGNYTYLTFLNGAILLGASLALSAMSVLLYIDVRVRTEGIDIESRIEKLLIGEGRRP